MRTRPRRWRLLFGLVAVAPLAWIADIAASSTIEPAPLRYHDPVVVQVSRLGDLEHHDSRGYRLYSRRRGTLEPTPFQLDERDGEDFVFRDGTGEPAFTMDGDDELVFMARDAGEQATPDELPPITTRHARSSCTIRGPEAGPGSTCCTSPEHHRRPRPVGTPRSTLPATELVLFRTRSRTPQSAATSRMSGSVGSEACASRRCSRARGCWSIRPSLCS